MRRLIGEHPERQFHVVERLPDHRVRVHEAGRAIIRRRRAEERLARRRPLCQGRLVRERRRRHHNGRRAPDHAATRLIDVGVEAGVRLVQSLLRQCRDDQPAAAFLRGAEQAVRHRPQLLLRGAHHRSVEGVVQAPCDDAQAAPQHQGGDREQPRLQPDAHRAGDALSRHPRPAPDDSPDRAPCGWAAADHRGRASAAGGGRTLR